MLRYLNEWDKPFLFEYLQRNEEEAAFLVGNAEQFGIINKSGILRCGDYYGYFRGDSLKGVIAFYNMGSCFPHYETLEAVPEFAQLMLVRRFSMLLGVDRIVRPLFELVRSSKGVRSFEECGYYVNENPIPFKLDGAEFIDVSKDSPQDIISFVRRAYLRGFDAERSLEGTRLLLSQKGVEEDFVILSLDNKLVSQACIQAVTANTNQVGAVYTAEEERSRGYGKAVVSELCERIRNRGKLPTLIVNKENTPALNAYKALGFEPREEYLIIRLYS
ncbi:MAG TPA: GNAT family N-acetyltransferase [Negativicutes bacterium]|nr:GNAT family N-acetyltransferase [Negativicutes bacterium]